MAIQLQGDELQPFQQFLADYCAAYGSMNINRISEFFSKTALHCYGTGEDEVLLNREALLYGLQRDFSELHSVAMRPEGTLTAIQVGEDTICLCWLLHVEYSLKTHPDQTTSLPKLRYTMMLEQQGDWRVVHCHISAPLGAKGSGRSFPEA